MGQPYVRIRVGVSARRQTVPLCMCAYKGGLDKAWRKAGRKVTLAGIYLVTSCSQMLCGSVNASWRDDSNFDPFRSTPTFWEKIDWN